MAILRKYEYINDINVYEVNLTEEQAKLFEEDEEKFWDEYGVDLEWDFIYDKVGDPNDEYELRDEE